ncbi:MAG: glycoside hydrolase family 16 protein [Bacteroidales bacterium]|nr:glycoside hydrolase family 16 protein [Bacteroidales bacterium]MCF8338011.1 glycoside hydrolase family 16 protein [Bacteroidales bacterium]
MKRYLKFALIFIIASFFSFTSTAQNGIDDFKYDEGAEGDPDEYSLVWADEFNTDGAINPDKWFHQTKLPSGDSWFNNEIQHYTDRTDNAMVDDSVLKIIAKKETYTDQGHTKNYTSARLNSKFAFTYGKVEVKAKLPTGVGTWPAIWMLGKNINNLNFGFRTSHTALEKEKYQHLSYNLYYVK